MSAVSRVSAFAKRRRLNDDSVAPASESDGSSTTSLAKESKPRKIITRHPDTSKDSRRTLLRDKTDPIDDTNSTNGVSENSFEPLVDAKAVSFIGTREIEQIDGNTCKIRLSRGQKCSLHGIARLWVREGSIFVYGAVLSESSDMHTMFFSSPGSFTDIVARSKVAEIQLESSQSIDSSLPSTANVPGKLSDMARRGAMSFRILGQSQDDTTSSPETASDIDVQIQRVFPRSQSVINEPSVASRILCCGKRSFDTYRASISLVNHLLTYSLGKPIAPFTDEVAFLDLDFAAPAFCAPGTISVAMLRRPVLGPPYTWPLQQHSNLLNKIVAAQYVGAVDTSEIPKIDLHSVNMLLSAAKEVIKNKYLIIRTGAWLAHMTQSERSQIQKNLCMDLTICIDSHKTSLHYEAAQAFSENTPNALFHLPMSPCTASSLSEHKLLLQSHFRLYQSVDNVPFWYREPIPDTDNRRLVLSTDDLKNEITFLQVRGGMLRPQDIPTAIHQNLVVIVATPTTKGSEHSATNYHDPGDFGLHPLGGNDTPRPLLEIRESDDAQVLQYIGLAYVEGIDCQKRLITLNTPVSMDTVQKYTSAGHEIGLVLEKPGTDGRFGRNLLF